MFRSILRMCVQNLKLVALAVPEIIGGTPKISAVPGYAHVPFSPKCLIGLSSDGPVPAKFEVGIALPFPEIIAIAVLGWG